MTKEAFERFAGGAREAVAIAAGDVPAPRIHMYGHAYVPEDRWQPIETAPKSYPGVILGHEDGELHVIWWQGTTGAWIRRGDDDCLVVYPTHWMPLPEPPTPSVPKEERE